MPGTADKTAKTQALPSWISHPKRLSRQYAACADHGGEIQGVHLSWRSGAVSEQLFCCCDRIPWPRQLKEERVYFDLWFQRDSEYMILEKRYGDWGRKLSSHSQTSRKKQIVSTWNVMRLWNLTAHPQWHSSSSKSIPPRLPQIVPPPQDQVSKYISLWGIFSFKLPQTTFVKKASSKVKFEEW